MTEDAKFSLDSRIAHHKAFKGYNCGCCTKMTGNMAIVSILVSDISNKWLKPSIDKYMKVIKQSSDYIMTNGGREAGLTISLNVFYTCSLNYRVVGSNHKKIIDDVMQKLGYHSICELRNVVMQNNPGINNVAVLLVFNDSARSFAMSIDGREDSLSTRRKYVDSGEYAFIYFRSHRYVMYTICHELFHLYGAVDYYYPEVVKREAERYFPDSIMLCCYEKSNIDNLTRYLIGWDNILNTDSIKFLNNTMSTRRPI